MTINGLTGSIASIGVPTTLLENYADYGGGGSAGSAAFTGCSRQSTDPVSCGSPRIARDRSRDSQSSLVEQNFGISGPNLELKEGRPGFEIVKLWDLNVEEPNYVAWGNQFDFLGLAGPWIRQTVKVDQAIWQRDCEGPPDFTCTYYFDELFKLGDMDANGIGRLPKSGARLMPDSPGFPSDGVLAAHPLQRNSTAGDTHRTAIDPDRHCKGVCKIVTVVEGFIQDMCVVLGVLMSPGNRDLPLADDVVFILLSRATHGPDCCGSSVSFPHHVMHTCFGVQSRYRYRRAWNRCEHPKCGGLPEPPDPSPSGRIPDPEGFLVPDPGVVGTPRPARIAWDRRGDGMHLPGDFPGRLPQDIMRRSGDD